MLTADVRTTHLIRIVDDDEALTDAIRFVLEGEGFRTAAYPSAEAFLAQDDPHAPGCLLLDVRMDGLSGPQLYERLRSGGRTLPVIFLSAHGSIDLAVDLMQKGAVSFLPKPVGSEKLLAAVERALEASPAAVPNAAASQPESLSARERQVAQLVAEDLTNREIAERLGVSKRTVEFFRANAMRKLGLHLASELKALVRSGGLG